MSHQFSIDEIFEIAEQIERNGAKFYREAASSTRDVSHQDLLRAVFDMESDPFAILASGANMETILTTAIGREKESIVFYAGLKGGVSVEAGRAKVDAIIGEELIHVALLSEHLQILRGVPQS